VNLRLLDDGHGGPDAPGGAAVPLADQLGVLDELRGEGKLDLIGVSNVSRDQAEEALDLTEVASVQNGYSLLDRTHDDLLELCRERGLAFVPFFPLGSAFTGGPVRLAEDPVVSGVAARHGVLPSQVALAWLLHRGGHVLLIPGTSSVAHLEENLAAYDVLLGADDLAVLDEVTETGDPMAAASGS
jgi:pyridoxine 4-dehydrogenase